MSCGIYKFENKINGMVYIGQAIDLEERYKKHCKNINDTSHNEDFYIGLREFGLSNFDYSILEEFDSFDQNKLNELEIYYIEKYNSMKPNGYNMVPGGTNGAGLAKGKAVQQYDLKGNFIAEYPSAHQANYITGINYSSICACCRGEITHTKQYQWKYLYSKKIIKDISNNVKIMNKKVLQYSLNKKLLATYNSMDEASKKTNTSKSLISRACNHLANTGNGFLWRFEDEPILPFEKIKTTNMRKVAQFDKNGNLLAIYNSITEAAEKTQTNCSNLQQVCANKRKTANNFIWKYVEEK